MMRRLAGMLCLACPVVLSLPAAAQENTTYTYDTQGRLTGVSVDGGAQTTITLDSTGNRANYTVTGAATSVSFAISGPSAITEGGTLVYTVTKTGSGAANVNFATANGTATSGSDFTANSGTLSFASSDTTKTISVATTDDSAVESAETVLVNLSGATGGATITTSQASGTINDNDVAPPSFAISNAPAATEGGALVYTVTKTGSGAANVNFATANGTATSGSDFTANSGTLSFASGDTTKTISVATIDDSTTESAETVLVNLSGATSGATITTAQASGSITDNDTAPTASFAISSPAPAVEGNALVYTVTKSGTNASNISVNYASGGGTATAGSDYTAVSGTLTFTPSDTTKTITVPTINDSAYEPAETVLVSLSGATGGATITTSVVHGTIIDNDVASPSFAISNAATVTEGGTLVYTVTKTGSGAANVNFATASGTATSGSDFTANSGTLSFASGDTAKTISVATIDDATIESPETVSVSLSSPTGGATITTTAASGSINDNDGGSITLTSFFPTVLTAHSSVYACSLDTYNDLSGGWTVRKCWLISNLHQVYYESTKASDPPYFLAPGYSFIFGDRLAVQSAYYGTAP